MCLPPERGWTLEQLPREVFVAPSLAERKKGLDSALSTACGRPVPSQELILDSSNSGYSVILKSLSHLVRLNPGQSPHCKIKTTVQPDNCSPCKKVDWGTPSKQTSANHKEQVISVETQQHQLSAQHRDVSQTTTAW